MIVHIAHSVLAADAWTRIYAFVSHACLRVRAIIIQYALRATTAIRIPEIFHYTSANSCVTLRIGSARCRRAWIRFWQWNNCNNVVKEGSRQLKKKKKHDFVYLMENLTWIYGTGGERVTGMIGQTWTNWHVIYDAACGQYTAWAWTGISALLLHASHIGWTFCIDRALRSTIWRTASVDW